MCLAIPAQIAAIGEGQMATVSLAGVERAVSMALTPEARVGDYVLVHAGYAISLLDAEEAAATLQLLDEIAGVADDESWDEFA